LENLDGLRSGIFCPASDFFQYFNPSNACLQVVDLIEFFLLKLSPILKKVTLLKGDRTVETAFCSKPLDLARSKPEFEPYRLHAVFAMLHTNMSPKNTLANARIPSVVPRFLSF
jgi:hypothetical protein